MFALLMFFLCHRGDRARALVVDSADRSQCDSVRPELREDRSRPHEAGDAEGTAMAGRKRKDRNAGPEFVALTPLAKIGSGSLAVPSGGEQTREHRGRT